MKNLHTYLLLGTGLLFSGTVFAQVPWCATDHVYMQHVEQTPSIEALHLQSEAGFRNWLQQNLSGLKQRSAGSLITIPVVFHIIYHVDSPQQNIPDTAIYSQMDVINADFRRLNEDTDDVRSVFDSLMADVQFEFCLAAVDPSGNPTTGIIRKATNVTDWDFANGEQDDMKFTTSGGDDAWPKSIYLNIWSANMTFFGYPGVLGFSHFPWDTDTAKDGIVVQYNAIGNPCFPFGMPPGNGRTLTHEIGHWFGLFHTWGNESWFPGCDSSDYVDDTPNQSGQSNNDCLLNANTCSNESPLWGGNDPPDMVENHLDYSNDTCRCMFTEGQKARMMYYLYGYRSSLFNTDVCDTGVTVKVVNEIPSRLIINADQSGNISLRIAGATFKIETILIFNIAGEQIAVKEMSAGIRERSIELETALSPGVYMMMVTGGNQVLVGKALVP